MQQNKYTPPSEVLQKVVSDHGSDRISLFELRAALHQRGFGLLNILFAVPLSIPVPLPPGLASIISFPLLIFAVQMLFGMDSPWIPKWLGHKTIDRKTLAHFIEKSSPYLWKVEKLMRPRYYFGVGIGERIVGLFSLLFGISILFPFPLSNNIPAIGIVIMSLGLLSKDGIIIAVGMIVGSLWILLLWMGSEYLLTLLMSLFPWFHF